MLASVPPTMSQRAQRVASVVKSHVATILVHMTPSAIVLKNHAFCVTRVHMSADLRLAKIYITTQQDPAPLLRALKQVTPSLHKALAQKIQLKHCPTLRFLIDTYAQEEEEMATLWALIRKDCLTSPKGE